MPSTVNATLSARVRAAAPTQFGLLALAILVGLGAGVGAVVFRWMIQTLTKLFSDHADYSSAGPASHHLVPWLGPFFVVLAPAVAGLVYGPLVHRFAPEARGHGVPEVMVAVARNGGRIRPQVALVKSLASALCIGGGGSVGREGPIVQIGSALGSSLAQAVRLDERHVKLLVACGAAGGIAATFNAPLAGVFFSMELILGAWTAESFGIVVVSSVTASVVGRAALGDDTFLNLPDFHVEHLVQYPLFAVLGVLAGLFGVGFAPSLFVGAMLGAAFGSAVQVLGPDLVGSASPYALVGMGAVFAGAARAPITAVVILFELTGEYTIILPLMLAIVVATGVSHLVSHDTVYTRKLLRRGIDIEAPGDKRFERLLVSTVMSTPPTPVDAADDLRDVAAQFARDGEAALPVVEDGQHAGVVVVQDLMEALVAGETVTVAAVLRRGHVEPGDSVTATLEWLEDGAGAVGVVDEDGELVGWVRHRDVLTHVAGQVTGQVTGQVRPGAPS